MPFVGCWGVCLASLHYVLQEFPAPPQRFLTLPGVLGRERVQNLPLLGITGAPSEVPCVTPAPPEPRLHAAPHVHDIVPKLKGFMSRGSLQEIKA